MQIGEFLDEGLAKGIEDNTKPISKAMDSVQDIATRSFESDIAFNTQSAIAGNRSPLRTDISADESSKTDVMIGLLEKLVQKSADVYLDKDTLIGEILDGVDKGLADRRLATDMAVGGAF